MEEDVTSDIWEKVAPEQRLSELLKLLKEQKGKEQEQEGRENAREKKYEGRDIQLAQLIEVLGRSMLELQKRVTELEKKIK